MPVIGIIDDKIRLIKNIDDNGNPDLVEILFSKIGELHETYPGWKDIAYLHIWHWNLVIIHLIVSTRKKASYKSKDTTDRFR